MSSLGLDRHGSNPILNKISDLNWMIVFVVCLIAGIGITLLYSVAGGSFDPWAMKQLVRFGVGMIVILILALVDIRVWMFLAYPIYFLSLALLLYVEFFGHKGMGATRWINLGFMNLQPSELMKISLILALARYYHMVSDDEVQNYSKLLFPLLRFHSLSEI